MASLTGPVGQWALGIVAAVAALAAAYFALPKLVGFARRAGWWLLGVVAIGLAALFLIVLPRRYPPANFPDSALPLSFREGYWAWLLVFLFVAIGSALGLARSLRSRRFEAGGGGEVETPWPELNAAWDEVMVRLEQAGIDPADQRYYLLIAPEAADAASLAHSAGLQIFVEAPEAPSPIHAFATSEGVLLTAAGVSGLGGEPGRMEILARKLLALRPDCPVLAGVVVLFPIDWASRPESVIRAAALRDDLGALRRVLKVRPPVFSLVPRMETVPGFPEFVARLATQVAPQMVDQRVGFAIPAPEEFSGDLVQRGMTWMSGWFGTWTLNLLAGDPLNDVGNGQLVMLDQEIRRYRKRLRALMESAFSTHREAEPVLFRGCYFAATGEARQDRAFTAGLLRGARSRILADHTATEWTAEAEQEDRRYLKIALAITVAGGIGIGLTWLNIAQRTPLGWAGLAAIGLTWAVVLVRLGRG